MADTYRCVYIISLILIFNYEVSAQNYYHTLETENEGNMIPPREKPEHLFGFYGNLPPQTTENGNNGNIKIPNSLYKYPVNYIPMIREVPLKVINGSPMYNNIHANDNFAPRFDTNLVANEPNRGNEDEDLKLAIKENILDDKNADSEQRENHHDIKDDKHEESNVTIVTPVANESMDNDDEHTKHEITKQTDTKNVIENKSKAKNQLIGKPFIKVMNMNIVENNEKSKPNIDKALLKDNKVKDNVKKIVITIPESDTTTVIISSRNDDIKASKHTKDEPEKKQNSHLEHQLSANNLKHINRRNLGLHDRAVEFNRNKPIGVAANSWPIHLAYTSHKGKSPFYSYLYPYNVHRQ